MSCTDANYQVDLFRVTFSGGRRNLKKIGDFGSQPIDIKDAGKYLIRVSTSAKSQYLLFISNMVDGRELAIMNRWLRKVNEVMFIENQVTIVRNTALLSINNPGNYPGVIFKDNNGFTVKQFFLENREGKFYLSEKILFRALKKVNTDFFDDEGKIVYSECKPLDQLIMDNNISFR